MVFTTTQEQINSGVYLMKLHAQLIIVQSPCWFLDCEVVYKARQRRTIRISQHFLRDKKYFEYLSEL